LAPDMVLFGELLELMSRCQFEQLGEDSVTMGQGSVPPLDTVFWWYNSLYQLEMTEPSLFPVYGTAVGLTPNLSK